MADAADILTGAPDDLLSIDELAARLKVSRSKLSHGWGPPSHPEYKKPKMWLRWVVSQWLRETQGDVTCSSGEASRRSGGSGSNTGASATVSRRVRQLEKKRRSRRGASGRKSNKRPALAVVPRE